jgi:nifR3 family TIM-barrel protein
MTDFVEAERPIVQQIFGADPLTMAQAAERVMEHAGPEGIDINMGCPVYKLTSNFNGAALMKEPELAAKIVSEMKRAIGDTPLSVKIRLGWDDPDTFKTFIPRMEEAGAQLITMHGRTKAQAYSGQSDWERLRQAKEIATVPFLANGDVHLPHQVDEVLAQTGADGVLIARGALGNPWFFAQALDPTLVVTRAERAKIVLSHAKKHMKHQGWIRSLAKKNKLVGLTPEELAADTIVTFRKHLSWYFKSARLGEEHIPGIKIFRSKLVRVASYEELEALMAEYADGQISE